MMPFPNPIFGVWLGGAPLGEVENMCTSTWGEGFILTDKPPLHGGARKYFDEAYAARHWAAASDVARLSTLYLRGGAYLDTDCEVVNEGTLMYLCRRSWAENKLFVAEEEPGVVCNAVLVAPARHPAVAAALLKYDSMRFVDTYNGVVNGPTIITSVLRGRADVEFLPIDTFYPWHWREKDDVDRRRKITERTAVAHHWKGSWVKK